MQFVHSTKSGKVTVPSHGKSSDVPPFIVNSVFKQAGLDKKGYS